MKVLYNTAEVPVPNSFARTLSRNKGLFSLIIISMITIILLLTIFVCYYARRYSLLYNLIDINKLSPYWNMKFKM